MRSILIRLVLALLILAVPATSLAAPNQAATHTSSAALAPNNPVLDAAWLSTPPVVDGDLSEWAGIERHTLDDTTASYPPEGSRPAPDDLSAWASIVWSTGVTERLFIAAYITDDIVVRNSRNWYFDDMAEFVFDINNDGDFTLGDMRLTFSPDGLMTNNGGLALGGESVIVPQAQGWLIEASVPLRDFGAEFLTNAEVGFTWGVQDDDGGGVRDQLIWAGQTYSIPSPGQGVMRFFNGPTREWRTYDTGDGWTGLGDTTIANWYPDRNFGTERVLFLRAPESFNLLMKIDLPTLAPGEQALQARLTFDVVNFSAGGTNIVRPYKILRPWAVNEATWNLASAGQNWAVPGAGGLGTDRSDVPSDAQTIDALGPYTFDIGSMIRDWYADPASNFGLIFLSQEGTWRAIHVQPSECGAGCGPVLEMLVESPPPGAAQ